MMKIKTTLSLLMATLMASFSALAQVPRIDSFSPASGHIGDPVTISGANFGPTPADNIVYFGAVRATVASASGSSLTAIVPTSATYAPITVTVGGLTASANLPFVVRFNSSGTIDSSSFASQVDLPAEPGEIPAVAIADLDGDGKPDLIVANRASQSISVFRNTSTSGSLTAASFAPKVDFSTPSAPDGPVSIAIADLDGDGRLDVVAAEPTNGTIFVYRNTSTSGNITFAPAVAFVGGCGGGGISIAIRDLDGDGKPDLVEVDWCGGTVNVLRNTSTPGTIDANSFAPTMSFPGGGGVVGRNGYTAVAVGDLDGDGLPDVAVVNQRTLFISLLRNVSTPGNIAFEAPVNSFIFGPRIGSEGLVLCDLNGDGKLDIAEGISQFRLALVQNNLSNGSFAPGSFQSNFIVFSHVLGIFYLGIAGSDPIAVADLDGDGRPDVVSCDGGVLQNLIPSGGDIARYPNDYNSQSFAIRPAFSVSFWSESIAIADLDGDGQPDVVTGNFTGGVISVFRNTISPCTAPVLISVSSLDGATIGVCFNQTVTDSAQNTTNYSVNNGAGTVNSATLNPDGRSVVLVVSGLPSAPNTPFTVTASGIQNACTEPMTGGGTASGVVLGPSITSLSPALALAGSSGFTLTLNGLQFQSGATVFWNGAARSTTFLSASQLQAAIPAGDLASSSVITTATVTVSNPDGSTSNPQLFTITSPSVGVFQSATAPPSQSVSVATPNISTALTHPGDAAVSATVNNAGLPGPIAVTAATYTGNPTTAPIIDAGGGYVDLKITGADAGDSATANFYYSSSVTGATENNLTLLYFTGTIWAPVLSSGGIAPLKNTTDNLDNTVSGGRFKVTFDNTSTPKITELSGTVFSMTIPDTIPPVIHCPANVVASTAPGLCSAVVIYAVTATDNSGAAKVAGNPPSGSAFPKGVTTVNCTATDGSGNLSLCSFSVTVNDTQKPTITCPASITIASLADVPPHDFAGGSASDNCPGVTVAWVSDSAPNDGTCGGTIVRTYRATDASGNQSVGTQTITVLPQLAFSDEHAAVHYHNQNAPDATAQNPAYSKAEVHGMVEFCDPGQISDGILSSLSARQVGARVKAILGGIVIADSTFTMSVAGEQRQVWEADLGKSGPVRSFKLHWQGALRFTDEDSNPRSPKISSKFIGLSQSNLRYEAKAGTYTTTLPNGVSVTVTNGKITKVTGLDATAYEIRSGQTKVDLELPYRLVPGMVIQTTGGIQDTITVTDDVNYWAEQGKYELHLQSNGLTQLPLFNATPDTLQYEITLGTGAGEHPAFGRSTIATLGKPRSQKQDNHKLFNDDATD